MLMPFCMHGYNFLELVKGIGSRFQIQKMSVDPGSFYSLIQLKGGCETFVASSFRVAFSKIGLIKYIFRLIEAELAVI